MAPCGVPLAFALDNCLATGLLNQLTTKPAAPNTNIAADKPNVACP